jgi:hypothetical protein
MPPTLPTRKIGGTDVSAIGYGAMGISAFYGAVENDEERLKVRLRVAHAASARLIDHDAQILDAVYESGCTFWDTADVYNDSEELLGKWCVFPLFPPIPSSYHSQVQAHGQALRDLSRHEVRVHSMGQVPPREWRPGLRQVRIREVARSAWRYVTHTLAERAMLTPVQSTTSTCITCTGAFVHAFGMHICLTVCRPDPKVPIETTVRAMVELVQSVSHIPISIPLG